MVFNKKRRGYNVNAVLNKGSIVGKLYKPFVFGTLLVLSGCSAIDHIVNPPTYDNNEYLMVAETKHDALLAKKGCEVDPDATFQFSGAALRNRVELYDIYSEHLPNNEKSKKMADELLGLVKVFNGKNATVGKTYCVEKFDHIITASDRILQALGQEFR